MPWCSFSFRGLHTKGFWLGSETAWRILKYIMRIHMRVNRHHAFALSAWFALVILSLPALQAQNSAADPKTVPVIDGGIGPCSADFTVTDATGAPVYPATIQVHIAYGFLSAHRLDLQVGTNAAGKARFTGLPSKTKEGLFFHAFEGNRDGSAFDDPVKTCKAEFTVALQKKTQ